MPTLYRESVSILPDGVRLLDRRTFPFRKEFVICRTCDEVAAAITDMVTQSNGPFYAAGGGMVLAARAAQQLPAAERTDAMQTAATRLRKSRPTNNNIGTAVRFVMSNMDTGSDDFAQQIEQLVLLNWEDRRCDIRSVGANAAELVRDGEALMTYCWSEGALVETLACLKRTGKNIELICPETRPYLQGARLTAHSAAEMGFSATVITDGMGACAMAAGKVSMLMTAADRVTLSGHVINKVGTLQSAISARHFRIPYFATVIEPDRSAATPEAVEIEERNPEETLSCLGQRTASPLAKGWYPAFDITPPELVSAVVTKFGTFPAAALSQTLPRPARGNKTDNEIR